MYKSILRPLLFRIDAEKTHYLVMGLLKIFVSIPGGKGVLKFMYGLENKALEKEIMGLRFNNPIGLAAGFDKDGKYIHEMASLGFGYIEVGTVTPKPQAGNDKPRLFRLKDDEALINRMGFNNEGVDALVHKLKTVNRNGVIIGGNIGKNKTTPNEDAAADYLYCFERLYPYVDYFVVNISSPNTPGLRELQEKKPLSDLITALENKNKEHDKYRPILLKIAPDLTEGQLDDIVAIIEETGIAGLIATNTTINRSNLKTSSQTVSSIGTGGLSGLPLRERATQVIKYLRNKLSITKVIIGVGGIHSAPDAKEKLEAGADLIQLYTGFIYEGPTVIKSIKKLLLT